MKLQATAAGAVGDDGEPRRTALQDEIYHQMRVQNTIVLEKEKEAREKRHEATTNANSFT